MARDGKELLLSRKEERFQTQLVGSTRVVLCSDDVLPIGEGTDIGSHLRDDEHGTSIALYAEEIALSGTVRLGDAIVSAQRLTPIDTNPTCLDLHGDDGAPPNPPAHTDSSEPAIPGGAGAAGSTLRLFLQDVDAAGATPGINVQGGAGANGQQGTDSTSGGDAGAGGAGGHVLALVSHPYLRLLDELRTIYAEADFGSKTSALRAFLDAHEGTPILAPLGDALGGNPTPNSIDAALHAVALVLAGQAEAWGNRFEQALNLRGGSAGLPGQGAPPGNRSTLVPLAGSVQIALTGSGSAMSPVLPPAPFLWVHPAQCAMALEKAKLTYFVADPVTAPDTVKDAVVLFRRLRERTAPFSAMDADGTLAKAIADQEASLGALGSLDALRGIHDEATRYLGQLDQGLDFFGYRADEVPLGSFDTHKKVLEQLVDDFGQIEADYLAQFAQLEKATHTTDAIAAARSKVRSVLSQDQANVDALRDMAAEAAGMIDELSSGLSNRRKALEAKLAEFEDHLRNALDVDPGELLSALSTVAWASSSQLMWLAQGAQFLYGAETQIVDDKGNHIRKAYLVRQVKQVAAKVHDILEAYTTRPDGEIAPDDPGASKLLTEQGELEKVLDGLYGKFPSDVTDVKQAFQDYVDAVLERNTHVLRYNAIIALLLRTEAEIASAQARNDALTDDALAAMQGNAPSLTAFVSTLYYRARAQVLESFGLAARAFRFWALSDTNLLTATLGSTSPPSIDHTALVAARSTILTAYGNAIDQIGSNANEFPANPGDRGICVALTSAQVAVLKTNRSVMVKIPVARAGTTTAHSPFAGLSNVRIRIVRAWLEGAVAGENGVLVNISHTGREQIVDPQDQVFTFEHSPRDTIFQYHPSTRAIIEDGLFGYSPSESSPTYALFGPFTYWSIEVRAAYNADVDLSGLTGVILEFHGTNYAFAST